MENNKSSGCVYYETSNENHSQSFEVLEGQYDTGLIVLCDHASNMIETHYNNLGIKSEDLERHIAYDIGVAGVARYLNRQLNFPTLMTKFSRLVIDPNRGLDDPTLIMKLSDGAIIPGNAYITAEEATKRVNKYYLPYHQEIDKHIDQSIASGHIPALFSIHSFTENWKGVPRPWHISVLWDKDPRFVKPLLDALRLETDIVVGENVPYSGEMEGDTMYQHASNRGLAHALIEIRQDLISTEAGQKEWADRLARILSKLMADQSLIESFQKIDFSEQAA